MITIEKWSGLVTNASPYSLPPGAAVTQVNVQVINPGQLLVRPGAVTVGFATESTTTSPLVRAMRTPFGGAEKIIHQNSLGQVYVSQTPYPEKIVYPLRLLHSGGILRFSLGGVTQFVSPAYFWNGKASTDVMQILDGLADLQELGTVSSPSITGTVSVQNSVDQYVADNPGASLVYSSIEAVMVDARNVLFGWNVSLGVSVSVTAHVFPPTSASWITPDGGGGALPEMPIYQYLPLRRYQTLA